MDSFEAYGNINPTAESFEMTRQGNLRPSLYNGAMTMSLPIFTYEDNCFRIPISLDYYFDGYVPGRSSGTVGYGWTLDCGGVITREVRGFPDEGAVFNNMTHIGWFQAKTEGITYTDDGIRSVSYMGANPMTISKDEYLSLMSFYDPNYDTPVYVTDDSELCDPSPDIFHFNFCGHSGDFMMLEDGSFRVFNSDLPYGEVSISVNTSGGSPNFAEFIITLGDGTEYRFGGSINCVETFHSVNTGSQKGFSSSGLGNFESNTNTSVTAFRLHKITAPTPDPHIVEFSYSSERQRERSVAESHRTVKSFSYLYGNMDSGTSTNVSNDATSVSGAYSSRLEYVSIDGRTAVTFYYENKSADEDAASNYNLANIDSYVVTAGIENTGINPKRLSGIYIKNASSQMVINCTLSHTYAQNGTPKMFLSSLSGLPNGDYDFSYQGLARTLPKNDTRSFDHWGYWNGRNVTDIHNHVALSSSGLPSSDLYAQMSDNVKESDSSYSSTGALSSVTYPTGGRTDIEYEGNTAGRRRTSSSDAATCTPYEVGGVRVKRISNISSDGMSDSVGYIYSSTGNGTSSGILGQMPRYAVYTTINYESYHTSAFSADLTAVNYSPRWSAFPGRDSHIGYTHVIEEYPDGSWCLNEFTNVTDGHHDIYDHYEVSIDRKIFTEYDSMSSGNNSTLSYPPSTDRRNMRGLLFRSTVYDSGGTMLRRTVTSYSEDQVTVPKEYFASANGYYRMPFTVSSPYVTSVAETVYSSGTGHTRTETTTYNSKGQVTCRSVNAGDASGIDRTYYRYLHETASRTPLRSAVTDLVRTRTVNGTERIVSKLTMTYSAPNVNPASVKQYLIPVPAVTSASSVFSTGVGSDTRTTQLSYDSRHRLVYASFPGNASVTYEWSGNNPVTRIANGTEGVTAYEWKDMVGLTKITVPSGHSTSCSYDSRNRPEYIRDTRGKTVERFRYFFMNDTQSTAASGMGGGNYVNVDTFTDDSGSGFYRDVTYYNGLGYEDQYISQDWSASGRNLVTPVTYDVMRHADSTAYLPYAVTASNATKITGAAQAQQAYYSSKGESRPYSGKTYEQGPDGRPEATYREGSAWAAKPAVLSYTSNTSSDSILNFSFAHDGSDPSVSYDGVHNAGSLLCTTVSDEDGRVVRTYSDGFGRVLCSRQVDAGGSGVNTDTYFIYDLRDSLVCVIPPEGTKTLLTKASTSRSFAFSSDFASSHCFLWWRDGLSRMTGSEVPGGGKYVYAYDARGRLVEETSPRLTAEGFRREYVYDDYDRLTTERYVSSARSFMARNVTYYSFSGGDMLSGDFAFEAESGIAEASDLETSNIKGLLRYEHLNIAPGSASQTDGTFTRGRGYHYDAYGRVIQTVESDSDGWLSRYSTKYDFRGNIMAAKEKHKAPDGRIHYMTVTYTRDLRGRVTSCSREVDGVSLPAVTYSYDDLGRLISKSVASRISESYAYDIHGWETGRSASYAGSSVFSQTLSYASSSSSGVPGLYSGLISESVSSHNGQQSQTYGYRYDSGARLTEAVHLVGTSSSLVNTEKDITYDLNGNIKTIKRYGATTLADNLSYTYSGNRLTSVTDAVESSSYTYTYDEAGNMTSDTGKGHVRTYNVLNLPHSVSAGSNKVFRYIYLSDGTKVSAYDSSSGAGLHYRGSFVFTSDASGNEVLSSVTHDEGRIVVTSSGSTLTYKDHWFVRDHLGSVRTVIDITSAGTSLQNALVEQNDYLPFGTRVAVKSSPSNLYRYNGKEEQQIAGTELVVLDYGARTYDPWLSRWTGIDPLAAKYHSTSPYAFCNNSPISFVDLDGRRWINKNGQLILDNNGVTKHASKVELELINEMNRTRVGRKQLQKLASLPYNVVVDINETENFQGYGITYNNGIVYNKRTGEFMPLNGSRILIYKKTATNRSLLLTTLEAMAVNFSHEIEHTTKSNLKLQFFAYSTEKLKKAQI